MMRTRRPARLCLTAGLLALLAIGGLPSNGAAVPAVVLGAQNVFQADRTASIEVEVPTAATYPNTSAETPDLRIEGHGRIVGFSLQPVGSRNPAEALTVLRFNGCAEPGCRAAVSHALAVPPAGGGSNRVAILRAGRYRLTLFADGAPVTARLRLGRLLGNQAATVTGPAESHLVTAQSSLTAPSAANPSLWSGGGAVEVKSTNTLLVGYFHQEAFPSTGVYNYSSCHFSQGAQPAGGQYLPGCPSTLGGTAAENSSTVAIVRPPSTDPDLMRLISLGTARVPGTDFLGFAVARAGLAQPPIAHFAALRLS